LAALSLGIGQAGHRELNCFCIKAGILCIIKLYTVSRSLSQRRRKFSWCRWRNGLQCWAPGIEIKHLAYR